MATDMWPLPGAKPGSAADDATLAARARVAALDDIQLHDRGADISHTVRAGLPCVEARTGSQGATMLYLHGGGFRIGGAALWAGFASRLAVACTADVIVPEYPLAPEHPFPGALAALAALYHELAEDHSGHALVLAGDSAGGGLATALSMAIDGAGWRGPSALVLFSPWLDLTLDAASFTTCRETDTMFSLAAARAARGAYLAGAEARHPLASPLYGTIAALPPTLVSASASEVLRDDAVRLASGLASLGKPVELHVESDLPHVWPILQPQAEATAASISSAGVFVRRWTM